MFLKNKWMIPIAVLLLSIIGIYLVLQNYSIDLTRFQVVPLLWYFITLILYYVLSSVITPIFVGNRHYALSFWLHRLSLVSGYVSPVKIGLPLKIYFFKKYLNVPISRTSASILFETVFSAWIMLLGGLALGGYRYIRLDDKRIFVILLCLVMIGMPILLKSRLQPMIRLRKFAVQVIHILRDSLREWKKSLWMVFIVFLLILLSIVRMQFAVSSVAGRIGFVQIARAVLVSGFVTAISMVPGGIGIREVTIIFFLAHEGVSREHALLVSLFDRFVVTLSGFVLGMIASFYVLKMNNSSKSIQSPQNPH